MNKMTDTYRRKVYALLSRHGYAWFNAGGKVRLRRLAIRGFTSEEIVPHVFNSLQGAMDHLLPLLGSEFSADYHATFPEN